MGYYLTAARAANDQALSANWSGNVPPLPELPDVDVGDVRARAADVDKASERRTAILQIRAGLLADLAEAKTADTAATRAATLANSPLPKLKSAPVEQGLAENAIRARILLGDAATAVERWETALVEAVADVEALARGRVRSGLDGIMAALHGLQHGMDSHSAAVAFNSFAYGLRQPNGPQLLAEQANHLTPVMQAPGIIDLVQAVRRAFGYLDQYEAELATRETEPATNAS